MKHLAQTKTLLGKIASLTARGLTMAIEMQHYHTIYLAGGGHEQIMELKKLRQRSLRRRKLYELERTNYITTKKQGDRLIINLTTKGRSATLLNSLYQAPHLQSGFSTLVIFDIPEQAKRARQTLRLFLKSGGFKQLQKSVWMLNRDVVPVLQQFISEYKLGNWVRVFRAEVVK
ncbi:MAG: CRISPR-associated endonuclease Cas2 [Patescibacteria group bacterium]